MPGVPAPPLQTTPGSAAPEEHTATPVGSLHRAVFGVCLRFLLLAAGGLACLCQPLGGVASAAEEADGVSREKVVVPMVFPVAGKCSWCDTFLAPRDGGKRRHHGNDIMAPKMTPLVAVFNGRAYPRKSSYQNMLTLVGDNGWTASYMHINNDTPGTDDGAGSDRYAFVPGLRSGCRVKAGQVLAYTGDSGNAENTPPHLHFELCRGEPYGIVDPAPSLRHAQKSGGAPASWKPDPADPPEMFLGRAAYGIFNFAVTRGDIFVEGTVTSVDPEAGRVVVAASSVTMVGKGKVAILPVRSKAVTVYTETLLHWADTADAKPDFADIREHQRICVLGTNLGVGAVLPARHMVLSHGGSTHHIVQGRDISSGRHIVQSRDVPPDDAPPVEDQESATPVRHSQGGGLPSLPAAAGLPGIAPTSGAQDK